MFCFSCSIVQALTIFLNHVANTITVMTRTYLLQPHPRQRQQHQQQQEQPQQHHRQVLRHCIIFV